MSTIVIAGGATGIGRATMDAFRRAGDQVLLADNNAEASALAIAEPLPGAAERHLCDLADEGAAATVIDAAIARFGGIDTLFVNAAILASAPLADWTPALWAKSLAVNLTAPFLLAQAAAPHLARSDNASIIFTASTGALRGHAGMPAYHATKAGLLGLCRSLADELAPQGIRVNCVLPGWIETPFNDPYWDFQADRAAATQKLVASIPMGRQGQAGDVAGVVQFLASAASRYVTGTSIVVDGGYSAV
ncbi:SDR family NAD(P)-dependent oxidoreductase [uncultured Devosia sp.]|uniref:SDR family NAD(P)-dependent oxidoreductase n=1 Tax=uncultured Devosia sp. TaxID=211434 RepID=UPI0035CC6537